MTSSAAFGGLSLTAETNTHAVDRLISTREACAVVGLSRWTLWRRIARGKFPKPISLAKNHNAFRLSALTEWIAEKERESSAAAMPLPVNLKIQL